MTGLMTLVTRKDPKYFGPSFQFGTCSFMYFVERYTLSPTLNGFVSVRFLSAWVLYSAAALSSAFLTRGHNVHIFSAHSPGFTSDISTPPYIVNHAVSH